MTRNKQLIGILNESDILNYVVSVDEKYREKTKIEDVMTKNYMTVNEQTPFIALKSLIKSKDSIIIIDNFNQPIQIITKIDLVEWFVN